MCIVDMGTVMTRIKALDPQENGKIFPIQARFEISKAFFFEYLLMIEQWEQKLATSASSWMFTARNVGLQRLLPCAPHSKHVETGLVVQ